MPHYLCYRLSDGAIAFFNLGGLLSNNLIPWDSSNREDEITPLSYISTYFDGTDASKIALYRAIQRSDFSLDDVVGETIEVQHIVCHFVSLVRPDTGEPYEGIRTVMIATDGTRFGTVSDTVRNDLRRAESIIGRPAPWTPPMRFKVVKYASRNQGRKYLSLEMVG